MGTTLTNRGVAFTDTVIDGNAKNGITARGSVAKVIARGVADRQHSGRPLFHWWGGWDVMAGPASTGATCFRIARFNALDGGCKSERGYAHGFPLGAEASTTSGIYFDGYFTPHKENIGTSAYPTTLRILDFRNAEFDTDPAIAPGYPTEQIVGLDATPTFAGCVFEDSIEEVNDISTTVGTNGFSNGLNVLAAQTNSASTDDVLRERFMHVFKSRRPTWGWACNEDTYVEMSTAATSYRYFHDQVVGTGGTAPSSTGPGLTAPLRYSAAGLETSVRVYVWVYAAMSGATDTGALGVANKVSGTMSAFRDLTNATSVSGTAYAWYPPLGTFTGSTNAYFLGDCNTTFDRILLGAKSNGATDKVRIKAWMMAVYPFA